MHMLYDRINADGAYLIYCNVRPLSAFPQAVQSEHVQLQQESGERGIRGRVGRAAEPHAHPVVGAQHALRVVQGGLYQLQ